MVYRTQFSPDFNFWFQNKNVHNHRILSALNKTLTMGVKNFGGTNFGGGGKNFGPLKSLGFQQLSYL